MKTTSRKLTVHSETVRRLTLWSTAARVEQVSAGCNNSNDCIH